MEGVEALKRVQKEAERLGNPKVTGRLDDLRLQESLRSLKA